MFVVTKKHTFFDMSACLPAYMMQNATLHSVAFRSSIDIKN